MTVNDNIKLLMMLSYTSLQILNLMNDHMKMSSGGGALLFLPLPGISKIPFGAPNKMVKNMKEVNKFLLNQIESHEKCLDLEHPRDFIDLYLKKMAETKVSANQLTLFHQVQCISVFRLQESS